jgi:hypothetical protein
MTSPTLRFCESQWVLAADASALVLDSFFLLAAASMIGLASAAY